MNKLMTGLAMAALLAGCQNKDSSTKATETKTPPKAQATEPAKPVAYDIHAQYKKFAPVKMDVDTSFLSDSERAVVNKLMQVGRYMDAIYLRQLDQRNPAQRKAIRELETDDKDILLKMFNLHYRVCDSLADDHVFFGDEPCPKGAGFYPPRMTKKAFNDWINENPQDAAAFRSPYTVIQRKGNELVAVPYSEAYKQWLEPAAQLMREAADLSEEPTLKRFLNMRADAFMSDDYYESEMAWMDLEGNIEIAIGPYEVYDDGLFGYKTAFEMFLTVKNPEESAALAKYKNYLRDMEANLPVEEKYKNFKRGFESPIAVTYQVKGGGDNMPGVQTIAFNLPNDERVREAKGAKKVILNNVLGAKYDRILEPIGKRVLVPAQAKTTVKKYMSYETLFHELSHSLGPGNITVNGRATSVNAELKDLASGLEEGKADVMGAYNVLYMMERGELPIAEKDSFMATYFTGLFRAMRFGINAAHGKGAAIQYSYFREVGAVKWNPQSERFRIDFEKMEQAISDLTGEFVRVQGDGDYEQAKAFIKKYAKLDKQAKTVLGDLDHVPVDIRPIYPNKI